MFQYLIQHSYYDKTGLVADCELQFFSTVLYLQQSKHHGNRTTLDQQSSLSQGDNPDTKRSHDRKENDRDAKQPDDRKKKNRDAKQTDHRKRNDRDSKQTDDGEKNNRDAKQDREGNNRNAKRTHHSVRNDRYAKRRRTSEEDNGDRKGNDRDTKCQPVRKGKDQEAKPPHDTYDGEGTDRDANQTHFKERDNTQTKRVHISTNTDTGWLSNTGMSG